MLNPYFLIAPSAVFFGKLVPRAVGGWQQKRKDVQPRLNRLEHGYPFLRAAMCTLMRDISANIAILDIMRARPRSTCSTWATTKWRTTPVRGPATRSAT